MAALVAGTDSIGLVAAAEKEYYETIEFYSSLGFKEIRSYAKNEDTSRDPVYCNDSQREAWLLNIDDESDDTIMLKIRLVPEQKDAAASKVANGQDWRRESNHLSFRCRNLNVLPDR